MEGRYEYVEDSGANHRMLSLTDIVSGLEKEKFGRDKKIFFSGNLFLSIAGPSYLI